MNFVKRILAAALLLGAAFTASAQLNLFEEPRTITVTTPQVISATRSNDVIDIHGWVGTAKLDLMSTTNSQTNQIVCTLYTSPDRTNFTPLTYALGVPTTIIYTNNYYGTATPLATNNFILPGAVTTPSASQGFTTRYIASPQYTNTGSITFVGAQSIGFEIADAQRYLQIVWTVSGQTNGVGATLTARKQQQ